VICPKCGEAGFLRFRDGKPVIEHRNPKITAHMVSRYDSLEVIPYFDKPIPPTFIRYMGADSTILPFLLKIIPPHRCYVEVFGGSAKLLLAKPPSKVEVYNDIDGNLVNLFMVVSDEEKFNEFVRRMRWLLYSREIYFTFLKKMKNKEWKDDIDRAVMTFYCYNISYGGKWGGGFSAGPATNQAQALFNIIEKNLPLIHERLKRVYIERLDFRECIRKYDHEYTFFYLDPPHLFLTTETDNYYRLQERFSEEDFMDLLQLLKRAKGLWLLKHIYLPYLDDLVMKELEPYRFLLRFRRNIPSIGGDRETRPEPKRYHMVYSFYANYNIMRAGSGIVEKRSK